MNFYHSTHQYYCSIDLHARSLYVCILDQSNETLLHKEIPANPEALCRLIEPYRTDLVIGVECMHCWYWVADFCEDNGITFILGHALYMRATRDLLRRRTHIVRHGAELKAHVVNTTSQYNLPPNKVNLKTADARKQLRSTFDQPEVQRNIDLDMTILDCYSQELYRLERFIEQQAKQHNPLYLQVLRTVPGIGRVLALTILYEIGDIQRFDSVQKFASYARLVKCKAESAGKSYGTQGNKIGNAHLKWAFSEAAVLYLKGNPKAQRYLQRLQKRMSKAKALSALAHKLGRAVYFMLKNGTVFNEQRFLAG
ncbi:IS110 family transposase [Marinobacterium sp. BA1]|uniref:IS110 family transposase n=1 Tax=Marinobacterium sp. BA1 TaxID=3138931 RepID=UPI0032E57DC3